MIIGYKVANIYAQWNFIGLQCKCFLLSVHIKHGETGFQDDDVFLPTSENQAVNPNSNNNNNSCHDNECALNDGHYGSISTYNGYCGDWGYVSEV